MARALSILAAVIVAIVLVAPTGVGLWLQSGLERLSESPSRFGRDGTVEVTLAELGTLRTAGTVIAAAPHWQATGSFNWRHTPAGWFDWGESWPQLLAGEAALTVAGTAVRTLYAATEAGPNLALRWWIETPADWVLKASVAKGALRLFGSEIELASAMATARGPVLDAMAPVPFEAEIASPNGALRLTGELARASDAWNAVATIDHPLAIELMGAHLLQAFRRSGQREPDQKTITKLASRRLDALVTLGYLRRTGKTLTSELSGSNGEIRVFGEPIEMGWATSIN